MNASFKEYTHNKAIIYAHLEGQYPYEIIEEENYTILLTPFDFHFCAGDVPKDQGLFLKRIITFIKKEKKQEFVLFCPSKDWEDFLEVAIKGLSGVKDARYLFQLDHKRYHQDEQFAHCVLEETKNALASTPLLQAVIKKNGKIVSRATALMTGDNHVEIDVYTDEQHRRKGFAYQVSKTLIDALLNKGYTPDWCCWKVKDSSQELAKKLGFVFDQEIPAFLWVSELKAIDEL